MTLRHNTSGGTLTIIRATKVEAPTAADPAHRAKSSSEHQPVRTIFERKVNISQFTDPATLAFRERTAKAEAPRADTVDQDIHDFAQKVRLSDDARVLFGAVAKHYERTGKAIQADGFELARLSGIPYDAVKTARQELSGWGHIVTRSDNAMGVDGLYPGPAWRNRGGRW